MTNKQKFLKKKYSVLFSEKLIVKKKLMLQDVFTRLFFQEYRYLNLNTAQFIKLKQPFRSKFIKKAIYKAYSWMNTLMFKRKLTKLIRRRPFYREKNSFHEKKLIQSWKWLRAVIGKRWRGSRGNKLPQQNKLVKKHLVLPYFFQYNLKKKKKIEKLHKVYHISQGNCTRRYFENRFQYMLYYLNFAPEPYSSKYLSSSNFDLISNSSNPSVMNSNSIKHFLKLSITTNPAEKSINIQFVNKIEIAKNINRENKLVNVLKYFNYIKNRCFVNKTKFFSSLNMLSVLRKDSYSFSKSFSNKFHQPSHLVYPHVPKIHFTQLQTNQLKWHNGRLGKESLLVLPSKKPTHFSHQPGILQFRLQSQQSCDFLKRQLLEQKLKQEGFVKTFDAANHCDLTILKQIVQNNPKYALESQAYLRAMQWNDNALGESHIRLLGQVQKISGERINLGIKIKNCQELTSSLESTNFILQKVVVTSEQKFQMDFLVDIHQHKTDKSQESQFWLTKFVEIAAVGQITSGWYTKYIVFVGSLETCAWMEYSLF